MVIKFLDTQQVADLFGVKKNTVEIMRHRGVGPKWVKFGRSVRYRETDLEAYIETQTRTCTNQSEDSLSHV